MIRVPYEFLKENTVHQSYLHPLLYYPSFFLTSNFLTASFSSPASYSPARVSASTHLHSFGCFNKHPSYPMTSHTLTKAYLHIPSQSVNLFFPPTIHFHSHSEKNPSLPPTPSSDLVTSYRYTNEFALSPPLSGGRIICLSVLRNLGSDAGQKNTSGMINTAESSTSSSSYDCA